MLTVVVSLLAAFPVELDAGFSVPIAGRAPQLVTAAGQPVMAWLDPRRAWLGTGPAEGLYLMRLRPDGGGTTPVLLSATGARSDAGFVLASGFSDHVIAVWESRQSNGALQREFAVQRASGLLSRFTGPSGASAAPLAATWSRDVGLVAWRGVDGGDLESLWVTATTAGPAGFSLAAEISELSLCALANDAGVRLAAINPGGLTVTNTPLLSNALPAGSVETAAMRVGQDQRCRALVTENGPTVRLLATGQVTSTQLPPGPPLTATPVVDRTPSGWFFVTLPRGASSLFVATRDGGSVSATQSARPFSLAAVGDSALVVSETSTGPLELRTFTPGAALMQTPPGPIGTVGAMRRSPTVAWLEDRWLVAWEAGPSVATSTRVVEVFPDASVGSTLSLESVGRPRFETQPQTGEVLLHLVDGAQQRTQTVELPFDAGVERFTSQFAQLAVATRGGVMHLADRNWSFDPFDGGMSTNRALPLDVLSVEAAASIDDEVWLVVQDAMGFKVVFISPDQTVTGSSTALGSAPAPFAPVQAVIATQTIGPERVALVGVRESATERWHRVTKAGAAMLPSPPPSDVVGLAVIAWQGQWIRARTTFPPSSANGQLVVEQVTEAGAVNLNTPPVTGEPGVPLLAASTQGTVAVVWPTLVDAQPRLNLNVVLPHPLIVDGGTMADAGQPVDAGPVVVDDAGTVGTVDAGGFIDAGLGFDAGERDDGGSVADAGSERDGGASSVDAGPGMELPTVDGGSDPPAVQFLPNACGGCSAADGMLPLLVLALLRRRLERPRLERRP